MQGRCRLGRLAKILASYVAAMGVAVLITTSLPHRYVYFAMAPLVFVVAAIVKVWRIESYSHRMPSWLDLAIIFGCATISLSAISSPDYLGARGSVALFFAGFAAIPMWFVAKRLLGGQSAGRSKRDA